MPDINGEPLPPLPDEVFDGEKDSKELKFTHCQHKMKYISANEIICEKCGVGYNDTAENIKRLFDLLA